MPEKSPLDFFTSSRKRAASKTAKAKGSVSSEKPAPQKAKKPGKTSHHVQVNEAMEILKNIQEMTQDLERQIQDFSKAVGKSPQEIEAFIETTVGVSPQEKTEFKQMKAQLSQSITDAAKGIAPKSAAAPTTKTSKKKGKPTGDLRTKNLGAKRKWMPIQ